MYNQHFFEAGKAPSVIRAIFGYGLRQKEKLGNDKVFDYSLGNPSIPAPKSVNETIIELINTVESTELHGYSVSQGLASARAAIAKNLKERFGGDIDADDFFMTCGAAPALIATMKSVTEGPESEIIAIAPYFTEYKFFVENCGVKFVVVPPDAPSFQIDMDALEKAITKNTCALIVNSPNNPSGVVYTEETLKKLAELLERKNKEYGRTICIIADEPYRELVYGGVKAPFIPNIYDHTVVCYSWSKSLSLPGERIGYVYVPKKCKDSEKILLGVASASRSMGHTCPPATMQRVVERCVGEMPDLEAYDVNRNLLYGALTEMGYECAKPDGAFYLFVKAPNGDDDEFCEKAKVEHNLLVVPGHIFGCPGYMRLSYCVSNDMIKRSLPAFQAMMDHYKK